MTNQYNKEEFQKKRIGTKSINNDGQMMEIIEYEDSKHMTILFDDGTTKSGVILKNFKKGNREYSPQSCVFVPSNINVLFRASKNRGSYPIGVTKHTRNRYRASISSQITGKRIYIGIFKTPKLAFYAYKKYKEEYIKEIAELYKKQIPKNLYVALYKWEIEITD